MTRIRGIQEAQDGMLRVAAAFKPSGAFDEGIKEATIYMHRYAVSITHVDSGGLRAAHHIELGHLKGAIYINPAAVRSDGARPAQYGLYEHARGGSHAFYARTYTEAGQRAAAVAWATLRRSLP